MVYFTSLNSWLLFQVDSDYETHEARVIFAKLPSDIHERKVLLLYPIMSSGNKVCRAMQVAIWIQLFFATLNGVEVSIDHR
jgi:hypothetical protein